MKLCDLKPKISKKRKKRLGRGVGSGRGGTSCKGHKGQKARTGRKIRIGFEGGQMPLVRRIPKRGFTNVLATKYQVINVGMLNKFTKDSEINPAALKKKKIISKGRQPVKVLGEGVLNKAVKISAQAFSKSAREKIEKAGGTATVIK